MIFAILCVRNYPITQQKQEEIRREIDAKNSKHKEHKMSEEIERVIAKSEIYDLSCKYMRGLDRLRILNY